MTGAQPDHQPRQDKDVDAQRQSADSVDAEQEVTDSTPALRSEAETSKTASPLKSRH